MDCFLRRDGRLLCAEANGPRIIAILPGGAVTSLATIFSRKSLRQPNDLMPDRKGGIVLVEPEMERGRSPRATIQPVGRGFSRHPGLPIRFGSFEKRRTDDSATRSTAAWCSQNPESVAAFCSQQGSLRVNDGPPDVGRDAITQVAQSFMAAFPDLCVVMDDLRLFPERTPGQGGRGTGSALAALSDGVLEATA